MPMVVSDVQRAALRQLPSVTALLATTAVHDLIGTFGRELTTEGVQAVLQDAREGILMGGSGDVPLDKAGLADKVVAWVMGLLAPTLRPVINGTGVIVHTNLGRAPLSLAAQEAIAQVARSYHTLEYDVATGGRGSRGEHAAGLLQRLTGAESVLVVNNNASAVILMLSGLCHGREVITSRSQLVEIGGGFRIPDIMAQSGAVLREVGTTNRTHLRDYAQAITENTAAILVTHPSNYKIIGFTTEPSLGELAALAHAHGLALLYDQGSGAMLDTARFGLAHEPTVQEGVGAGCDVVTFSGDKLLGGPQAGILCGRSVFVEPLRKHPLARAMRADKLGLAGLAATLGHFVRGDVLEAVPVWRMISASLEGIEQKAVAWARAWGGEVVDGVSAVGGGSLPGTTLPTRLVSLPGGEGLARRLRRGSPAVVGRVQEGRFLLDPRTVLPHQENELGMKMGREIEG